MTLVELYFSLAAADLVGDVPVVFIGTGPLVYPFINGTMQVSEGCIGIQGGVGDEGAHTLL